MCRVFLSYGHDEYSVLAERLKTGLDAAGLPTWFDMDRLRPGGDWERYIEEGLNWTSEHPGEGRFVLLMTPHSVRRPDGYCLNELAQAFARLLPIVPVMVAMVEPPLSIARLQWLDMRGVLEAGDGIFEDKLDQLRRALLEQELNFEGVQSRLVARLQPLSFEAEIHEHLPHFTGRRWVSDLLDSWLSDPEGERAYWITGGPGAGKSALSAWLTTQRREVAAVHFCQHTNARKIDPRQAAMSIAYQLSTQLPEYEQRLNSLALEGLLDEMSNAETLFDDLIVQPLSGLEPDDGGIRLLLVDALDEATERGQNEFARLLAGALTRLPQWLRLILTSRPDEPEVAVHLQGFTPHRLEDASQNADDLKAYVEQGVSGQTMPDQLSGLVQTILDRSEGSFLYVRWVTLEVEAGRLDLRDSDAFPRGLGAIYHRFFERQFPDLVSYSSRQRPVLEAMGAAKIPLPVDEVAMMLDWSDYDMYEVPESFGSLVAVREGALRAFHLSVLEWVADRARAGQYWAAPGVGRGRLADYGWAQYELQPDAMPAYALRHASTHLLEVGRVDASAQLLLDYRVLRCRTDEGGHGLVDDLRDAEAGTRDPERARALELVRSVFELAAGIFVRDPDQLASQLQARLLSHENPLTQSLVDQALANADVPVMRSITPALRQAGDPLTRVFRGTSTSDDDPDLFALGAVALDESRDLALAAGEGGVALAWRLSTGRIEQRLPYSESGFSCGALDRVGGRWALGGWDGSILILRLEDLSSGLGVDGEGGEISGIDFSPDGMRLCSAHNFDYGERGAIGLWDADTLESIERIEVTETRANAVAFSPDGLSLAVGVGKELRVGPAGDLSELSRRASFSTDVEVIAYSPDSTTLAVGVGDGTISVLPARGRSRPRKIGGHPMFTYTTSVSGMQYVDGGRRLVSAGWDAALRVWDTQAGVEVAACHADSKVFGLAVDGTGRWALTGLKMGGPRLWDLNRVTDVPATDRHGDSVHYALGLDGIGVVVTGGSEPDGASIRVWNASNGALEHTAAVTGNLHAFGASKDERMLHVLDDAGVRSCVVVEAAAGTGARLELGQAAPLEPMPDWYQPTHIASDVAVTVQTGYPDNRVVVWRGPEWAGKPLRPLKPGTDRVAISADGRLCAVLTSDAVLQAFDLRRRRTQRVQLDRDLHDRVASLAVSPSGARVALATEQGAITLVDLDMRQSSTARAPNGDWIGTVVFSGDETRLVAATSGGRLEVWDVARGAQEVLFCGSESWSAVWASERADRIIAGDAVGAVHFLVREPAAVARAVRV